MTTESVTALFTDMVGSTALASAMAPDEADELRRGHFSILRQAVAEAGGTEVKNLGDGLMVVFATASAALSCAVGMQQGVDRDNRVRRHSVGLRVGLSAGEVIREDDDYFGDPVIEAARLCAACESAQILAADVVRALAGRRSRHVCHPLGELALKGLPDPVLTVEVAWESLSTASHTVPLPGRLGVGPGVGVVGRGGELALLLDALKRVSAGDGREVLLISGEAGLGKTTLVAETARVAFDVGARVLFGHCEEDLASPYQLFAEALSRYVTHAPEEQLLAHVAAHGSELARLVPALESRIPDLPPSKATDADSERYLLFAAVVGLLAQATEEQPIVAVFDDLQWADKASLLLLQHLAAAEQTMRLLVLGTYRDTELSHAHPLMDSLAALHRQRNVSRIELAGLDDAGVIALMEAAAGHALDEAALELARAVHRETDGNPFFVTELLRHLSETGAIHPDATGRWVAQGSLEQIALPDSIREVIGARIGRLGLEADRVLAIAAVIGRDFDLELLATATKTSQDELLDILDHAMNASLVREFTDGPGRYSFAHALIQHAMYQALGSTRQARTHRVVAEALEELCGDRPATRIGELARHWGNASPSDVAKALDYARQAGDAALRALAPDDALRYYAQAVELIDQAEIPDPSIELDVAIGLGTAQRQTGEPGFRETLLNATRLAAELGDTERLVAGALANDRGWASASGTVDGDKVALLEVALDRLPADHPDRALVLATLCAELAFASTIEHRQALADEALAIVKRSGDDATVVRVLNHLVFPLLVPSLLEQSLAWSADALSRAERVGDPVLLYFAAMYRATVALRSGDIADVDRCYAIAGPLAQQLNQPSLNWEYTFHGAKRAQIAGMTDDAERLATEAFQIGADCGQPDAEAFFGVQLAVVNWQRGTMGELAPLIEQMIADSPGLPTLKAALALAYAQSDRFDDARRVLDDFAATGFQLPQDSAWINGMTEYAEAAVACGDPSFAQPLFDLLKPWSEQFSSAGGVTAEGPVSNVLGGLATLLGNYDDADCYFAQAATFNARIDAEFFAAQTNLLWGTMLAQRQESGDTERARDLLTNARDVATTHGYANVERRAAHALGGLE